MKQVDMSFGFSCSDVVLLAQLAWTTVRNSRKACGEYAELTRETTSLHVILQRLEREIANPESPINRPNDTCREDLAPIVKGCGKTLDVLDRILEKYNALSDGERSKGKLWKAVRFGNGELATVKDLRLKLIYYTANLSLFLNMVSMGSMGVIEKQMYEAGGDLKEIRRAVNNITAHLLSGANKEGSVLTEYADDDKAVWRAFRRELVKDGFSSDVVREHKDTIQAYVKELGSRGILDDEDLKDSGHVSEESEDREPTQATPQSRDEAMGSFESESGAARDAVSPCSATTAHVDNLFGTGTGDQRENATIPKKTQIESAHLTMSNVSDTLPSIARADADINSLAESDSREVGKIDDRTNKRPSSAPIPFGQSLLEIAEEDTWYIGPFDSKPLLQYYKYDYKSGNFLCTPADYAEDFDGLSNPLRARSKTLEFQAEAKGFLKVAEFRTELRVHRSPANRKYLLKLTSFFEIPEEEMKNVLLCGCYRADPNNIIDNLMQFCRSCVDARPEKWRITEWPISKEKHRKGKHRRRGDADGDKGKRSTVPPAASFAAGDAQNPSSTTEKVETEEDDEFQRTGNDLRPEEGKGTWWELFEDVEYGSIPLLTVMGVRCRTESMGKV